MMLLLLALQSKLLLPSPILLKSLIITNINLLDLLGTQVLTNLPTNLKKQRQSLRYGNLEGCRSLLNLKILKLTIPNILGVVPMVSQWPKTLYGRYGPPLLVNKILLKNVPKSVSGVIDSVDLFFMAKKYDKIVFYCFTSEK